MQYTIDEVKEKLKNKPYKMIDDSFTMLSNGFDVITDDGYIARFNRNNLLYHEEPKIFYKYNPHTIYNIKHYLKIHNSDTELLSTSYKNNSENLEWKCSCGKHFVKSWNNFKNSTMKCYDCSLKIRSESRQVSIEDIEKLASSLNLHFFGDKPQNLNEGLLNFYDDEGYYYETWWSSIINKHIPERFSPSNKYTIQNINLYLKLNRNGEYYVLDNQEYVDSTSPLLVKHLKCGNIYEASWTEIKGKNGNDAKRLYYKQCPNCNTFHKESYHASVLKQVFIHEYPNTSLEERSCINPNTNRALPTDIVNHELKIAIEIQSGYHDDEEQKIIDKFKKDYWINLGYQFYDPDIRDYTILELIQLFFPNIHEIPNYIDFKFSEGYDFNLVQKYLDEGYTLKEISEITGYNHGGLNCLCRDKKISLPSNYSEKVFNKKSIVRLTKTGKLIERFDSKCEADRKGYKYGTISRVLFGKQKYAYDSLWVFENDYLNGNFTVPKIELDKYNIPIDCYDMNDVFIKHYNSIYDVAEDLSCYKYEVYNVVNGLRKSFKKYKFKISA